MITPIGAEYFAQFGGTNSLIAKLSFDVMALVFFVIAVRGFMGKGEKQ